MRVAGLKKWRCRGWRLGGSWCGFSGVRCRFPLTRCRFLKDTAGSDKILYSLRHTYATLELLSGTDIHTLARQMGTSVLMLERHYSKLTATLAADKLAG